MVTIWDVATRAGVSKSTVSLVINDSPLVREETRQRVLQAIKAMKYIPNNNARSLQRRNNNSIGIIHILRGNRDQSRRYEWDYGLELFSNDVEDGIFSAIMDSDTDMSVIKEHFSVSGERDSMPRILRNRRVDGAIFVGGFDRKNELDFIKDVNIPMVMVTSSLTMNGVDTVMHDPALGTKIAYTKLVETGHRRICLMNIPRHYRVWPKRLEGIRIAAEECGVEVDPDLMVSAEHNTAHGAYMALGQLLDRGTVPDAVLTADNEMAMGTLRCLRERKISVPEDVSVICYEDSSFCGNVTPSLSAVNIRKDLIGRTALGYLLDRIENPALPARSVTVEPYLVMRDSVLDRTV